MFEDKTSKREVKGSDLEVGPEMQQRVGDLHQEQGPGEFAARNLLEDANRKCQQAGYVVDRVCPVMLYEIYAYCVIYEVAIRYTQTECLHSAKDQLVSWLAP